MDRGNREDRENREDRGNMEDRGNREARGNREGLLGLGVSSVEREETLLYILS